eukprot:9457997-Lingulodinium_polyedra.AAC.1
MLDFSPDGEPWVFTRARPSDQIAALEAVAIFCLAHLVAQRRAPPRHRRRGKHGQTRATISPSPS